jgi:hypothetical protein
MPSIPFSVYEIFAELTPGFIVIAAVDYSANMRWILRDDIPLWQALLWVGVAYVVGNVLSNVAAWMYEKRFLDILGRSEELLLAGAAPASGQQAGTTSATPATSRSLWRRLFPGYYQPLPEGTKMRVLKKFGGTPDEHKRAVFLAGFGAVKNIDATAARLGTFITNYDFGRNGSLACLIAAAIILVVGVPNHGPSALWWFAACVGAAVGLLYRYLKFYRQYTYEVFVTYAALPD